MSKKGYEAWSQLDAVLGILQTLLRLAREHNLRTQTEENGRWTLQIHGATFFSCCFAGAVDDGPSRGIHVTLGAYDSYLAAGTEGYDLVVRLLASTNVEFRRGWLVDSEALADVERGLRKELWEIGWEDPAPSWAEETGRTFPSRRKST